MKLLHLDSSILGAGSASRELTAAIVERIIATTPGVEVVYRDLAAEDAPHVTLARLPGQHPLSALAGALDAEAQALRDDSERMLAEFLAADVVVIGVPMYNFTIPSQLKAWIDRIVVPGKTFAYVDGRPKGLAGDKRVILALARGGFYGPESGMAALEHAESYLRTILGFIGVTEPEFVVAEGLQAGPDRREAALRSGHEKVLALAA